MRFDKVPEQESFDHDLQRVCKNCKNIFHGRYCNRCGEKVLEPADKSSVHLFVQFINALTFLDNRFLRTIKLIFLRTGELSINFMEGPRAPFIRPISIFFIANLIYFLFPVFDTFNSSLRTQMNFVPHSVIASEIVEKRLKKDNTDLTAFTIRYQQQSTTMAKLLLIVFVAMVALALAVINYSSNFYIYDHLLISLEYNSILILLGQIFLPWLLILINHIFSVEGGYLNFMFDDSFYSWLIALVSLLVFYTMEKRVYRQDNRKAWIKALLMMPGMFIVLQTYRAILFFVTMWTL